MKILVASATEKSREMLKTLLETGGASVALVPSAAAARRRVLDEEWDALVINYPLLDESGIELAHMAGEETEAAVIMLLRRDDALALTERLTAGGVLIVEKPIMRDSLQSALSLSGYVKALKAGSEKRIRELEKRIDELKIVSKAKCALALREGMDEDTSHKKIERMAMDRRITLKDAALSILRGME